MTPTLDAVIQRAKNDAVTMTMCDGEVIYQNGVFTKVDKTAALKALHDDLSKALADDEVERRKLSVALLPHVRKFYDGYIDTTKHQPFYRPSSMVASAARATVSTAPRLDRVAGRAFARRWRPGRVSVIDRSPKPRRRCGRADARAVGSRCRAPGRPGFRASGARPWARACRRA